MTEQFEAALAKVVGVDRQRLGIGTLSEKTVHAILKNYYEPDERYHEIPVGKYYADICRGNRIIEIQTAQFHRMREKLEAFLPEYETTIVYPIARTRTLHWLDPSTGEIAEIRKSPRKGNVYEVFEELYGIKKHLLHPNLRIRIVLLDVDEYKLLDGRGRGKKNHASKFDRVPTLLRDEIRIETPKDYMQFVPAELERDFTSKDFALAAKIPQGMATTVLNILDYAEVVERIGKKGNAYLYQVKY